MQQERYSYFRPLNPLERVSSSLRYACTGLSPSCEMSCPSFLAASNLEEYGVEGWVVRPDEMKEVAAATGTNNWIIPANMDFFTTDVPHILIKEVLESLKEEDNQTFFVATRNPTRMQEYWFASSHFYWGYSASTQDELNFYAQTRFSYEERRSIKEVLFLDPLVEKVILPETLLQHFKFIFVDGYHGHHDLPLHLEWIEAIADQLSAVDSPTQLIIEGVGDRPTYRDIPYKTRKKKLHDLTIDDLT